MMHNLFGFFAGGLLYCVGNSPLMKHNLQAVCLHFLFGEERNHEYAH